MTNTTEHEASLRYARAEVARHRENGDTRIADELEELVNTVYDYVNERGGWAAHLTGAGGAAGARGGRPPDEVRRDRPGRLAGRLNGTAVVLVGEQRELRWPDVGSPRLKHTCTSEALRDPAEQQVINAGERAGGEPQPEEMPSALLPGKVLERFAGVENLGVGDELDVPGLELHF